MGLMEWSPVLGNLGEFVGSVGVIVTLVYLSVQIRNNTSAMRASAGFEATQSWAQLNEQLAAAPEDCIQPFVGIWSPDSAGLTEAQYLKVTLMARAMFQKLEGQYFLFRYGHLDAGLWQQRSAICRGVIDLPFWKRWWDQEKAGRTFSPDFVNAVENTESMDVTKMNRRPLVA